MLTSPERLLRDKVAIVTGAARGIGYGIAAAMAREGATVILADVDAEKLKAAQATLQAAGGQVVSIPTDVSRHEENEQLVADALRLFGRIDILINNVGIRVDEDVLGLTAEGLHTVMQTNFVGPALLASRTAREMIARKVGGALLFTSSVHSHCVAMYPAYSCTKSAVEMFVKESAVGLARYGIRANAVAPGGIATRGEADRTHPEVPLGHRGAPEDVAELMVFLASEKGRYITGQTITVDGGLSIHSFSSLRAYGLLD